MVPRRSDLASHMKSLALNLGADGFHFQSGETVYVYLDFISISLTYLAYFENKNLGLW